jgi:phage terminase large subunit GpA-like protein
MTLRVDAEAHYAIALGDMADGYLALRPPVRLSVAEGAAQSLMLKRPGDAATPWSAADTPYMVEPMNTLASRMHEAVCFVGPAQSGKTASLGEGWMAHAVTCDPGDMLIVQMTEAKAREYSRQRITRAIDGSPKLRSLKSPDARDDNTHDKQFRHGMWLKIAWPTVTNLSSTSYRYVFITDLDRMPDDLDGEGDPFTLGRKRTTTFLSRGMCAVESSPGRPWTDPSWKPSTPHEAPPVGGILGIYNNSDRRRWYWQCPDCREHFEAAPGVGLFGLPSDDVLLEEVRTADIVKMAKHYSRVICPHCGSMIPFKHRFEMNRRGLWVPEGATVSSDGEIGGTPMTSKVAGFWLGGVAAAYQSWESLLNKHLNGLRAYAMTGDELPLRVAVNTDQAMPYMDRYLVESKAKSRSPVERAEDVPRYVVPDWTRCVVSSVDVQGGTTARFVVQVHAVGPHMEQQLVDRFEIRYSKREGSGADFAPIDPARYAEDWDVLTERVLLSTYRTPISDREIMTKVAVVDTGGEDGATAMAYAWFRRIRELGLAGRVMLYKGASEPKAPIMRQSRVGKRKAKDKGDIPLYICNPHLLSDGVASGLGRDTPGPGYIHFPRPKHPEKNPDGWVTQAFFDELGAEVRGHNGLWSKVRVRNETFDLCRMIRAGMLRLGLDKIKDWDQVPAWLQPLAHNELVITREDRREMKANEIVSEHIDETPQPALRVAPRRAPARRPRRSVPSPYLR